jgi:glycosyltransferase involved in cell wall biosynthesis
MKVLILLTYYHPHWTGLTQHARLIGEGLAKRKGWEVNVATTKYTKELPESEIINQVKVHRFPIIGKFSRSAFSLSLLFNVWGLISENDVVVLYLPYAEIGWVTLLTKLEKKKLILVHNGDLILPAGTINKLIEKVFDVISKWAIRLCDRVIVYSDDYAKHSRLTCNLLSKCTEILPPVEDLTIRAEAVRKLKMNIPEEAKKIIGFAGRFVEEKGFDILLKAMPQIIKNVPGSYFMFAGDTNVDYESFFSKVKSLINTNSDRLIWQGLLKREEMGSFYSLCDVFVLSSRSECFGLTQAEAMKLGVPVVASDIPGGRVPVLKTKFGILFRNEDPEDLALKITEVLNKRIKYAKFQTWPKKVFNLNKTINETEKLIRQVVGK